jgi:hypothetical protein
MLGLVGAPGKIRTPDPQIRSLVLYPAELPVLSKPYQGSTLFLRCCPDAIDFLVAEAESPRIPWWRRDPAILHIHAALSCNKKPPTKHTSPITDIILYRRRLLK